MNLGKRTRSGTSMYSLYSQSRGLCCFATRKASGYYDYPTGLFKKSPKRPKSSLLTGQQRLAVMRTWRKLSADIAHLGVSTMNKLLELDSDAKPLFGFRHKSNNHMQHDRRFRQHAFWLIQSIHAVLENIDRLDETVAPMLREIGEKHARIRDFNVASFGTLTDAWDFVWEEHLKERYTLNMQRSWDQIFTYIVDRLAEGFHLNAPTGAARIKSTTNVASRTTLDSPETSTASSSSMSASRELSLSMSMSMSISDSEDSMDELPEDEAKSLPKRAAAKARKASERRESPKMKRQGATGERSRGSVLSMSRISVVTQNQLSSLHSSKQSSSRSSGQSSGHSSETSVNSAGNPSSESLVQDPKDKVALDKMRKRASSVGRKGSRAKDNAPIKSSLRKLSEPIQESPASSTSKARKTSTTSEQIAGSDVTSAASTAQSHNNPPPSEEPAVARLAKDSAPKKEKKYRPWSTCIISFSANSSTHALLQYSFVKKMKC